MVIGLRKKSGIVIHTTGSGRRYQHDVRYFGKIEDVSQDVVDLLKKANERLYDEMPNGSEGLVSRVEYFPPRKR